VVVCSLLRVLEICFWLSSASLDLQLGACFITCSACLITYVYSYLVLVRFLMVLKFSRTLKIGYISFNFQGYRKLRDVSDSQNSYLFTFIQLCRCRPRSHSRKVSGKTHMFRLWSFSNQTRRIRKVNSNEFLDLENYTSVLSHLFSALSSKILETPV